MTDEQLRKLEDIVFEKMEIPEEYNNLCDSQASADVKFDHLLVIIEELLERVGV